MKILIVDDEELTRTGLISAIDWETIGITEIFQADDGANGLLIAKEHRPDIVLCDVRMPRMDGIAMLEQIEAFLPDIVAIFMSGYSDKEYLKAAIKLKAINYIEKPIEPNEIRSAVLHAVEQCRQVALQKNAQIAHHSLVAEQLAFLLTVPYNTCHETVTSLCLEYNSPYTDNHFKYITTFIVKLERVLENSSDFSLINQKIHTFLQPMHLHVIYSEKRMFHIVYHIFGTLSPSSKTLSAIAEFIRSLFLPFSHCYLAIGATGNGILKACHSYESAVILLQSSFFFEPDTILTDKILSDAHPACIPDITDAITLCKACLTDKNESGTNDALKKMQQLCMHVSGLMLNQVKTFYYELFASLYENRKKQQLMTDSSLENEENIIDIMDACFSFQQLHETLVKKAATYFYELKNHEPENATIYLIREYISKNYNDPGLSVKSISEYAYLSASYVCTYFKNETGMTLNQYITDFRMDKAKQLLSDPRYRITDISSAVGYSDGNYFGKSFKKYIGLSPSEYREKALK